MKRSQPNRGSVLVVAIILLAVLAAIAASAIILSGQGRVNASAQSRHDMMIQCAQAAQAEIINEAAHYGSKYFGSNLPLGQMVLPDGTTLTMGHYGQSPDGGLTVSVAALAIQDNISTTGLGSDITNKDRAGNLGSSYIASVHCVDYSGRPYEIEVGLRFGL